jgi:hypothetical protein
VSEIAVVKSLPPAKVLREKLTEQTQPKMFFNEARVSPFEAKEIAMHCDICGKIAYGPRHLMQAAMKEHARLYHPEQGNQMRLWYPRA